MSEILYRKAAAADAEALTAMRRAMFYESRDDAFVMPEELAAQNAAFIARAIRGENAAVWVAADGGEIAAMGFLAFFVMSPNEYCLTGKTAYLDAFYTIPSHRRRGIATRLLSRLVNEAKERQTGRIILNPTDMGRPLYEKAGFKPWSEALVLFPEIK